ncbi:conserved hypothetical protein [Aspergillus terreus NIH2624]|uniref:Maltose/galactoside acetyltransferase domain-containing protein n=1 Tax=Aspergillus terreus (strain NIH 2624 / FGSC A1156) TaxID=341663 RepID=Q0CCU2_ASPTN|nr:uncharacterized protein ATEG_08492 [Aspergillus terreus NIH2624]EAU30624.1 conserved hypothetical protein [Aspergillus terreus NIH2624]
MTPANSAAIGNDHEPAKDTRAEHSPSRFTAVNGKDSLTTEPSAVPAIPGSSLNNGGHVDPAGSRGKAAYEEHNRENGSLGNDQDATSQSSSLGGPAATNRGKRKRSECDEPENTPRPPNRDIKSPSRLEDMSEPPTQQQQSPNGVGITTLEQNSKPPSTSAAPLRLSENEETRPSPTNVPWNEYDSQLVNQAQRAQQIDASDAQLAEVLQREAGGHDTPPKNWGTPARSEGSLTNDQPGAVAAAPQERPQPVAPKRKRVFSNRTKTGCMTCRRRKKKCDEQHPASPVPLQSKDGYADIGNQYVHEVNQHDRQQSLSDHLEAGKMRPIVVEDADRAAAQFNSSPTGVGSNRGSWSKRTWPNTGHPPFATDHVTKPDYREVPSIHELPRDSHPKADYQIVPPIRELSHSAHSKPAMPLFQSGIDQRPALTNTSAMDTNTPQAQARMALSIEHQLSARAVSGEESEKEKMMRGELYRPFDIHLVEERDRCKAALWRFNNACNPISGLSAKEQNRLLKEIFVPPNAAANSPSGSPRPSGSIGQGAVVESPFQCHYGYNVHIGEDVMISESCLFVDDCTITIGAHTWIGPRVTILSSMAHANMQERKGSQSRHQGRPVTIEEDCYVGAGCTIYPGVRLRRGAYVAPGEVVKSDIVAYGFQGLKPSYM